jgi:hypothetical protein
MIVDRGFIMVEAQSEFINWIQINAKDTVIGIEDSEPSIYLITDDFLDDDLVIKQYYEEIILTDLFKQKLECQFLILRKRKVNEFNSSATH